jgi:hypothetical protein
MNNLSLAATSATPAVNFDAANGQLDISGESYPENAFEFFKPLLAWVAEFLNSTPTPVVAELKLSYLNTSSIKSVMDLLDLLEAAHRSGRTVTLRWYYHQENDRALEMIEEFKEEVTLPFFVVPVAE